MGPQSSSTGAYQMRPQSSSTACNEIQPLFKGINLLKEYKELSNVNETLADKFFLSQIESLHDLLLEKDKIIEEKDVRLKEKDLYANRIIAEKDIRLKEKDMTAFRIMEEKDIRLKEKDAHILVIK